jgi:hypothetical protein
MRQFSTSFQTSESDSPDFPEVGSRDSESKRRTIHIVRLNEMGSGVSKQMEGGGLDPFPCQGIGAVNIA